MSHRSELRELSRRLDALWPQLIAADLGFRSLINPALQLEQLCSSKAAGLTAPLVAAQELDRLAQSRLAAAELALSEEQSDPDQQALCWKKYVAAARIQYATKATVYFVKAIHVHAEYVGGRRVWILSFLGIVAVLLVLAIAFMGYSLISAVPAIVLLLGLVPSIKFLRRYYRARSKFERVLTENLQCARSTLMDLRHFTNTCFQIEVVSASKLTPPEAVM